MALTRNDIAEQLLSELGLPKNRTVKMVESLLEEIKSTLHNKIFTPGLESWSTGRSKRPKNRAGINLYL